jgi:hypothetical protein
MGSRISNHITKKEDIDYLLSLNESSISTTFMMEMFGEFKGKRKFNPYDTIEIPIGFYGPKGSTNKNKFITTVGIWVFNKYFIENDLFIVFKYINQNVDSKMFNKINSKLSYAVLEDDIDLESMKRYLMKTQKFMPYVSILSPNHTLKMLTCTKVINKKKEELIKKYKKEIENGNELVADIIEKELMDFAKEYMGDDPSMDMYLSGARGSFGNNFKNIFIMKGAIKDPDPNKGYNIATSNYIDGIKREEYATFANSLAAGPYARANKTQIGGYIEKQFSAAFQHLVLDAPNSDCGTKYYITITLSPDIIDDCMYNYIIEGDRLIELTSKNVQKYIGRTVKMRFSSMCESKNGICNKCIGNLYYRLGITNAGVTLTKIPSTLKNISMKSFHDSTLTFYEMDPMKAFGF